MKIEKSNFLKKDNATLKVNNNKTLSFDNEFKNNKEKQQREELIHLSKEINKLGERILITQNYTDILNYKKKIQIYLKSTIAYLYETNSNQSFWKNKYFTIVEVIDNELNKSIEEFMTNEAIHITIVNSINEINGLIIDSKK